MLEILIIITAIAGLSIASAYDLKWKYVPDYISYSLLVIGFSLRGFYAIELLNPMIIIWSVIASASLFCFGYLLYKAGAWGGGDVKIMAVCGALLSWFPNETTPFFINFAINLLIIGAFYGVPAALIAALRKKPKIKLNNYERITIPGAIICSAIIIILINSLFGIIIGICLVLLASLRLFKLIEEKCFIKKISPNKLMDGDWLVEPLKVGNKVINPRKEGLTKQEVKLIQEWHKKGKIKEVMIKDGIAYVPVFLITLITTILFDNILMYLMIKGFHQ